MPFPSFGASRIPSQSSNGEGLNQYVPLMAADFPEGCHLTFWVAFSLTLSCFRMVSMRQMAPAISSCCWFVLLFMLEAKPWSLWLPLTAPVLGPTLRSSWHFSRYRVLLSRLHKHDLYRYFSPCFCFYLWIYQKLLRTQHSLTNYRV